MRWALGLQAEQDGRIAATCGFVAHAQAGVPGQTSRRAGPGPLCSACVSPAQGQSRKAGGPHTNEGLTPTVLSSRLSPSISFDMDLVGVFNREVGQLAPRHTAAG